MKNQNLSLCLVTIFIMSCVSNQQSNSLIEDRVTSIMISYTSDYCGGAPPSDQIIKNLKRNRPLNNKVVYFTRDGQPIQKLISSEDGVVSSNTLKEGTYRIFVPEKIEYRAAGMGKLCTKWAEQPNGTIEIVNDKSNYTVAIHIDCNPCLTPNQ